MKFTLLVAAVVATASTQTIATPAQGAIVTFGANSAVTSVDRSASFSALPGSRSYDLAHYTEGLLRIQAPASVMSEWPFGGAEGSGWWYTGGFGPYDAWTQNLDRITATDGARIVGVEFTFALGADSATNFVWETYRDGALVSSGLFHSPTSETVIGWRDEVGFHELRVGAFVDMSNGSWRDNSLAISMLKVELQVLAVPEPESIALWLVAGINFIVGLLRKLAASFHSLRTFLRILQIGG